MFHAGTLVLVACRRASHAKKAALVLLVLAMLCRPGALSIAAPDPGIQGPTLEEAVGIKADKGQDKAPAKPVRQKARASSRDRGPVVPQVPGRFVSRGGWYVVAYPPGVLDPQRVAEYVNFTESLIPALSKAFGLPPARRVFFVQMEAQGSAYLGGGRITIAQGINLEENVYGSLFHETVHGFLREYGSGRGNWLSEAHAIILQVEALKRVEGDEGAQKWAKLVWGQGGNDPDSKLAWEVYRQHGFAPFRAVYAQMGRSRKPIVLGPWDWVRAWRLLGVSLTPRPSEDQEAGTGLPAGKPRKGKSKVAQ